MSWRRRLCRAGVRPGVAVHVAFVVQLQRGVGAFRSHTWGEGVRRVVTAAGSGHRHVSPTEGVEEGSRSWVPLLGTVQLNRAAERRGVRQLFAVSAAHSRPSMRPAPRSCNLVSARSTAPRTASAAGGRCRSSGCRRSHSSVARWLSRLASRGAPAGAACRSSAAVQLIRVSSRTSVAPVSDRAHPEFTRERLRPHLHQDLGACTRGRRRPAGRDGRRDAGARTRR